MTLSKNKKYFSHIAATSKATAKEITAGLKILDAIDTKIVTVFGAHAIPETNKYYINCERSAYLLGKKGYAIVTGGGPGIMYAANSGAMKAKAPSIGFKAKLLSKEQISENVFTKKYAFEFLFARRFCLAIKSDALIFYPGGFGTFNEFFEYTTLIQTKMTDNVPVICVGKQYWKGLFEWMNKNAVKEGFLTQETLKGIHIVDSAEEVVRIIEKETK